MSTNKLRALAVATKATVAALSAAILFSCAAGAPAYAEEARNPAMVRLYKENNVCPSTGKTATKGKPSTYVCPGYVVDHGIPFCAGKYIGMDFDKDYNMFYQKHDEVNSLRKDKDELKLCAKLKILTNGKNTDGS